MKLRRATLFLAACAFSNVAEHAQAASGGRSGVDAPYHSLAAYSHATCNDQNPAVYYFRPARSDSRHPTRWLFYLEGGGLCNSDTANGVGLVSCHGRYEHSPGELTAAGWTPRLQALMSADPRVNPDFADANVVEVHYCSSDYWSGGRTHTAAFGADDASRGWDFHGREIAVAALTDLARRNRKTNFQYATEILFAGSSAGGVGIAVTLNDLLPLVPPSARSAVVEDAGFALETRGFEPRPPFRTHVVNTKELIRNGLAEWHGHGDTPCSRQYPRHDVKAQIECYDTGLLFTERYFGAPAFVAEAEQDAAQLQIDGWHSGEDGSWFYLDLFAAGMLHQLEATPPEYGAFGPGGGGMHTFFATDATFNRAYDFPGGGVKTPQSALSDWISHKGARYFGALLQQ